MPITTMGQVYYKGVTASYPNSFDVVFDQSALPDEIDTTFNAADGTIGFKRVVVNGKDVLKHTSGDGIRYNETSDKTIKDVLDGKVNIDQTSANASRFLITDTTGKLTTAVLP
jgi:hypothetical protein